MKTMRDFKTLDDWDHYRANMTREERRTEIVERQSVVDGILKSVARENREPTKRESQRIQHHRNVIASLTLGLENGTRDR